MNDLMEAVVRRIERIERKQDILLTELFTQYKGTSAADFTTTTLPQHGDYGFQTTDNELQFNCNGTIRAVTTAAL
jgi:hypothetical protein